MSVTTTYATTLSSAEITLNGSLDDLHGEASLNVSFQWGTTISYGNETTPETVSFTGTISATLNSSGLDAFHTSGTIYYFRAKATDGVTTWYGKNRYFVNLVTNGNDPFIIDNDMDSGTLTNTDTLNDVLLLDWGHGLLESPSLLGVEITSGSITPLILESTSFLGAEIVSGSITPLILESPSFLGVEITGGTIT